MAKRFYKHKIENLITVKKIVTLHYFFFDKDYRFKGESHDFWEIVYAAKSSVICGNNEGSVLLSEGNINFHSPGEFHTIGGNNKTASEVFVMTFECNSQAMHFFNKKKFFLTERLRQYIYSIIYEAKKTFDLPVFNPALNKLALLDNPNLGGQQMIRLNLEQLLILLMRERSYEGEEIFIDKQPRRLALSVIEYLKANIYNKVTLSDICEKFYYGKTFICTEFKKSTGKTVFEYFNNLKIKEAKKLIKKDCSFKEIAENLNFDSQSHFSSTFKKYEKITPNQYLKQA